MSLFQLTGVALRALGRKSNQRRVTRRRRLRDRFSHLSFESLEDRRLLIADATLNGGVLTVSLGLHNDSATISAPTTTTNSIQVAGTSFTAETFTGVSAIDVEYEDASQSITFNGSNWISD